MNALQFASFSLLLFSIACSEPKSGLQAIKEKSEPESVYLKHVHETGRISSNHYSDMVVDSRGNSYIACFSKHASGQDHIYICKLDRQGEVVWTKGQTCRGRSTSIAIGPGDKIWVAGFFSDTLKFGHRQLVNNGSPLFLACFSPDGDCLKLMGAGGSAVPFELAVSPQGDIALAGVMESLFTIGGKEMHNSAGQRTFIARIDSTGNCLSIDTLNGTFSRIRSDARGNFYGVGQFREVLAFGGSVFRTENHFDQDGFVLKLARDKTDNWIRAFGQKGMVKYGYRTSESGLDLHVLENGEIEVLASEDPASEQAAAEIHGGNYPMDLTLLGFATTGKLKFKKTLLSHVSSGLPMLFQKLPDGSYWVSGKAESYFVIKNEKKQLGEGVQGFLVRLDKDRRLISTIRPFHGPNMLFRTMYYHNDSVYLAGHYQQILAIKGQTLRNFGQHSLFWLRLSAFE